MIEENEGPELQIKPKPSKKNRKAFLVGIAAFFIIISVVTGGLFASYNYLSKRQNNAQSTQSVVAVSSTGLSGLDKWDIEGEKLKNEELREKYIELYNLTYPFLLREAIKTEILPAGAPAFYGQELEVDFEANTDEMTNILRKYEDHPLNDEQMERYKDVGLNISCEYCCGVKAIIFENGKRACGCAHSYAMRGLAKYLIINHPEDYTNDDILLELGKWKATFFPKQTISKAVLKYAEFGNIDPSILTEMPNMVGSC
jgi:hypothetical protein